MRSFALQIRTAKLAVAGMLVTLPLNAATQERWTHDKAFAALSSASFAMAAADASRTQWVRTHGDVFHENNPVMRPFTRNAAANYAASLGGATFNCWLSWRLKQSKRWHKVWWLPQAVIIGANTWGIVTTHRKVIRLGNRR